MEATEQVKFNRDDFIASDWRQVVSAETIHGYASISQAFGRSSNLYMEDGESSKGYMMKLLSKACSMMFEVKSINEPFKPIFQDFQEGTRSAIPEDLTVDELCFFEGILSEVDDIWLKARIADLLWLCRKPKLPDHARIAINAYRSHAINAKTWKQDVGNCWERACRLCLQIKDFATLELIEKELYSAFLINYADSPFMVLWLAQMLDNLGLAKDKHAEIAQRLFIIAQKMHESNEFDNARFYLELAVKKYQQDKDEQGWLDSLIMIAKSHELEADQRSAESMMIANGCYEKAIQGYRRIPVKNRIAYDVDNRVQSLRDKLSKSGEESLSEMKLVQSPGIDISEMVEVSQTHVSGKQTLEEALLFFIGLYDGPNYEDLKQSAKESIEQHPLSSMFGSTHMSSDGRTVAKTPAMSFSNEGEQENQSVLARQIQQQFNIEMDITCKGNILPALRQILMEHRVTRDFLEGLCYYSPFVSINREKLVAAALWCGFEYDFANSVHLLCPQFEHMVREQLKEAGIITSNVDQGGIENENGLSTLIGVSEANDIFGVDLTFEIKAIFTDPIGPNLRNEVAHGLLNDNSASNISSVYAWWMIMRLIIRSIEGQGVSSSDSREC